MNFITNDSFLFEYWLSFVMKRQEKVTPTHTPGTGVRTNSCSQKSVNFRAYSVAIKCRALHGGEVKQKTETTMMRIF